MQKKNFSVVQKVRGATGRWTLRVRVEGETEDRLVFGSSEKHCFYQIYNMIGSVKQSPIVNNYLPSKRSNSGRYFLNNNGVMVEE